MIIFTTVLYDGAGLVKAPFIDEVQKGFTKAVLNQFIVQESIGKLKEKNI